VRRPKRCPRLRRQRGGRSEKRIRDRKRSAEKRRRGSVEKRRRAKKRKRCDRAVSRQLVPLDQLGKCRRAVDDQGQYLVGRLASRPLPDPLPPGSRLDAGFARLLQRTTGRQWPLVLATLRAEGKTGSAPATAKELKKLAKRLRGGGGDERVQALADYHRAAGIAGLTRGLAAVKDDLIDRVLRNPKISIYGGGRSDVSAGHVDVRVLVTMLYLAERQGGITVTSLITGHGVFTKSGGISLHSLGRAMDIGAVAGTSILGNQQPGGVTESALRDVLLMPEELRPSELISLFAIGGPSFAMADHADHIHVGF